MNVEAVLSWLKATDRACHRDFSILQRYIAVIYNTKRSIIDCMVFHDLFNTIYFIPSQPVHLSMPSWVSLANLQHKILSIPLAAFPHGHGQKQTSVVRQEGILTLTLSQMITSASSILEDYTDDSFKFDEKWQKVLPTGRKYCGKRSIACYIWANESMTLGNQDLVRALYQKNNSQMCSPPQWLSLLE